MPESASAPSMGPAASAGGAPRASLLGGCSIEITARETTALRAAAPLIAPGTQVNVAFLAADGQDARVAAATAISGLGLVPMPHLSARRIASDGALAGYLSALARGARADRALVVGGDLPAPQGPYADALALIRSGRLAEHGIRLVGIAGYPGGHPGIAEAELWRALHDKCRALAALGHACEITTQFGFDAQAMLAWLARLRQEGVAAPVRLGVAGPASIGTLLRYAALCGVGASARILRQYGVSVTRLFDTAGPSRLLAELADGLEPARHGEVRLHFYPFGGIDRTLQWLQANRTAF